MKRWIRAAARLYPTEWRTRYGAEFELLLDEAPLRWNDLADVIRGAAIMRMTNWMTYGKMALLAGAVGALIAAGIAFSIPDRFVCTAALILEQPGATTQQVQQELQDANLKILGRDNLLRLIQDPGLGLYRKELQTKADVDVVDQVFRKNIHIVPYASVGESGQAFRIVFSYRDRHKAQAVVARLTDAFLVGHLNDAIRNEPSGSAASMNMRVLEGPVLPERPTSPLRPNIVIFGLITGTLVGLLSLKMWRRTRDYAVVTMSLSTDAKRFVDGRIATGQYRNASDYIGALIRDDEERRK